MPNLLGKLVFYKAQKQYVGLIMKEYDLGVFSVKWLNTPSKNVTFQTRRELLIIDENWKDKKITLKDFE